MDSAKDAGLDRLILQSVRQHRDDQPDSGDWRICSGCSGTHNPRSEAFASDVGMGCRECGGLGMIWDNTDYDAMARDMLADDAAEKRERALIEAQVIERCAGVAEQYADEHRDGLAEWGRQAKPKSVAILAGRTIAAAIRALSPAGDAGGGGSDG